MCYARIGKDGIVVEVIMWSPENNYHAGIATTFIPAPDGVALGWTYAAGAFTAPKIPLSEYKTAKLMEIITASNSCAALVKGRYSALEIDSWSVQQSQAETVLAGGTLPADALLTVLASANGVPVADFAARVMANVQAAEAVTKLVVSQQQGYEARLKAIMADTATDDAGKIAAIQGIVVKYELPEG